MKQKIKNFFMFFALIKRDLIVTKWPYKEELIKNTIGVVFFAIFFGLFISFSDILLSKFYNLIVF